MILTLIFIDSLKDINNILKKKNIIFVISNPNIDDEYTFKNNILTIKCNNTFDYLQFKTFFTFQTILQIKELNMYTHIVKINYNKNLNVYISPTITSDKLKDINYCGKKLNTVIERDWHFDKCPIYSSWYEKKYDGKCVPYIDGNSGYILSRHSLILICREKFKEIKNHIYDDLMISIILSKHNITPTILH